MGVVEGLAAPLADTAALGNPDPLGDPEPLGPAELLGTTMTLGSGKILLGSLAKASTKISTKMTTTRRTHGFARLSVRGGSEPLYPGAGASSPRAEPPRR
jgi:hypothetical protein